MKKLKKLKKLHIVLLLILIAVLGVLGIQGIKAKYTTSVSVRGNVTFSADLADSLSLYEHQASRKTDGSYELTDVKVGTVIDPETREPLTNILGNTYQVMPGVDIPKDPQIEITGKSALDSYLYVEIEDSLAQSDASDSIKKTIQYELTDEWLKLDDVTGPNGTTSKPTSVYVYKGTGNTPMILDETFTPVDNSVTPSKETTKIIKILKDDTITVGENYSSADFMLNIYAHLLQIPQDAEETPDAKNIFTAQLPEKTESVLMRAMSKRSTLAKDAAETEPASGGTEVSVVADDSASTDPEYVTITIKYVDAQTRESVFDDYVATLHYGTEFSMEVDSPIRIGYEPYLNGEKQNKVVIEKKEYTENVVYNVEYRPALVSYVVRHYIQNVSDDSYVEYKMVPGQLPTGSQPTTAKLSLAELVDGGFESLYHEPDTVAADGSTEFRVYYDRKYFLYTFDCNGGYGADPIYARYETPIAVPTPVKPGYEFKGWQKQDENGTWVDTTVDGTVGLADVSYKARWEPIPKGTEYTVIYWLESPEPDVEGQEKKYEYWGYETVENATAGTEVAGSNRAAELKLPDHLYAEYDDEKTDKQIEVKGDGSTVVNVYYSRKSYTLKFYYARTRGQKYYIAGGTTEPYAKQNTTNIETMLGASGIGWGQVKTLPKVKDAVAGKYTAGTETYGNYAYSYIQFNAKYGADISQLWPVGIFDPVETSQENDFGWTAYFSAWTVEHHTYYNEHNSNKTIKGNYLELDYQLLYSNQYSDADTIRFLAFWENGANDIGWNKPNEWNYVNYVPAMEGDVVDKTHNGVDYKVHSRCTVYDDNNDSKPESQTATAIKGYTNFARVVTANEKIDATYDLYRYTLEFYYKRDENQLLFQNYGEILTDKNQTVAFGVPLLMYNFTPSYPSNLESEAYDFDGWYNSAECVPETKVDWDTLTMPAGPLTLYAKWTPIQRTVKFYNHYQAMEANKPLNTEKFGGTVSHGSYLSQDKVPSIDPDVGDISAEGIGNATNYTPIGWFYIDAVTGEKKRFEPGAMKVTSDLDLFMEWRSNQVVEYTVEYYKVDEDGKEIQIAEPTTGYSFAGLTRTFKAKIGEELYTNYQTKHYPMEASHSILMAENGTNTFRFLYYEKESVKYKINYIDQLTKLPMQFTGDREIEYGGTTSDAVITKKFVYERGYMPDAFYKRLILSSLDEKNIINFYYTKDTEHAYYAVKHMIEVPDGGYEEYAYIQGIGNIGETVTAKALTIGGYEYDQTTTQNKLPGTAYAATSEGVQGKITLDGLEMVIYYKRAASGYKVRYVEYGTDISEEKNDLQKSETNTGKYGDSFKINPPQTITKKIGNSNDEITYILQGDSTYESTMGILNKDDDGKPIYPEIIFYYTAKQVQISYKAVCKTVNQNFGWVSIANERASTASGLGGCTATPDTGFQFVGWYSDEACTNQVSKGTYYQPKTLPNDDTTYYALFEPILSELTIVKDGNVSDTDTFLFRVKGEKGGTANIDLTVSITGKDSVTISNLPIGTYTVTELTDWSWRYTADNSMPVSASVTISEGPDSTVTFTNSANSKAWLGGEAENRNSFTANETPTT